MSLKPIEKLEGEIKMGKLIDKEKIEFETHLYLTPEQEKINELIEVVNEQSEIINNLRMVIKMELIDRLKMTKENKEFIESI